MLPQFKENLEARMKYGDAPEKFLDSEVDLDEEVRRLGAVAGSPHLYPDLVQAGVLPSLLALLAHDNGDIAAAVLDLLRELTDADVVEDSVRPVESGQEEKVAWRLRSRGRGAYT